MIRTTALLRAFRTALALSVVVAPLVAPVAAQSAKRPLELRVQVAGVTVGDDFTSVSASVPGALAFAWYLSPRVAIEPRAGITFNSVEVTPGDKRSGGSYSLGAFVPFYLRADGGRSGLFIAPGIAVTDQFGDFEGPRAVQGGLDIGLKRRLGERMATRWALEVRDRDSDDEVTFGGSFGLSFFWR